MAKREQPVKQATPTDLDRLAGVVLAIRQLNPQTIDLAAIQTLVGDARLPTLKAVARVFAVSRNTIQGSWRGGGMPGSSGGYGVANILVWLLQREARRADRPSNGHADGMRAVELESAKALLQIRRAKAERESGQYVPLAIVRSVLKGMLNVLRDRLMNIPRQIEPMFPRRQAAALTADVERIICNALTTASETPIDTILERIGSEDDASQTEAS